ncbi:MAG: lipopolysaccharide transport periplasmic protein LptA [Dokdonella sp.]|nr:MAG: lipopolysaccharide transport periplasmic protein LptA [Dokdonella sp.]
MRRSRSANPALYSAALACAVTSMQKPLNSSPMCMRAGSPRAVPNHAEAMRALLLATALLATTAAARSDDRNQPLDIRANHSRIEQTSAKAPGVTTFTGNVRMSRGTMRAEADQAKLYQHGAGARNAQGHDVSDEIQRVVLTGKPARLEEVTDDGDHVTSQAARIDYDADTGVVVLDGDVSVVRQGHSEFHGQHMTYNTQTGAMESGDVGGSAPVHVIIQPKAKPAAKPAAPAQPAGGA